MRSEPPARSKASAPSSRSSEASSRRRSTITPSTLSATSIACRTWRARPRSRSRSRTRSASAATTPSSSSNGTLTHNLSRRRALRSFGRRAGLREAAKGACELLDVALTHDSYAYERARPGSAAISNERLEFLGDAVLGHVVARDLYDRYPNEPE